MKGINAQIFAITSDLLVALSTGKTTLPRMPEDARIIQMRVRWETRTLDIMVEHESFPFISEGSQIPYANSTFEDWP